MAYYNYVQQTCQGQSTNAITEWAHCQRLVAFFVFSSIPVQDSTAKRSRNASMDLKSTQKSYLLLSDLLNHSAQLAVGLYFVLQGYPEYYKVIKEPIDIRTIAQRIQGNAYPSLEELCKDFHLMIRNAKHFNEPGSRVYKVCMLYFDIIQP